jgi:hypothetical protein
MSRSFDESWTESGAHSSTSYGATTNDSIAQSVADIDVEDVLQSVWLTVFKNLQQFRGEAAFAT